jgi:predicted HAD superfamily phosphohydrolase YqeG
MDITNELKDLEVKKNNLEKRDIDLIITDFDDTIFSRKEQLETDPNLLIYR